MKERPILFSGAMVRAILAGEKTQTRRVVTPQPSGPLVGAYPDDGCWYPCDPLCRPVDSYSGLNCPYGEVGDRLWVRETWATDVYYDHVRPRDLGYGFPCEYKAGGTSVAGLEHLVKRFRWRPSIHMPRHASRITLELLWLRVEPVQDISEDDARAEGVQPHGGWNADETEYGVNCRCPFSRLWDSINKGRGYGWAENPWVWVLEFRRVMG